MSFYSGQKCSFLSHFGHGIIWKGSRFDFVLVLLFLKVKNEMDDKI